MIAFFAKVPPPLLRGACLRTAFNLRLLKYMNSFDFATKTVSSYKKGSRSQQTDLDLSDLNLSFIRFCFNKFQSTLLNG